MSMKKRVIKTRANEATEAKQFQRDVAIATKNMNKKNEKKKLQHDISQLKRTRSEHK